MAWTIRRDPRCPAARPFAVVGDGDVVEGCHPTRPKARRQLETLYTSSGQLVPEPQVVSPPPVKSFDPHELRDEHGRWTDGGTAVLERLHPDVAALPLITEARGDSRPVSEDEFRQLAQTGRDQLQAMMDNSSPPRGLDRRMSAIKARAFSVAQQEWGGATFDAHTGHEFTSRDDKFALSVKPPGAATVNVPENATRQEFEAAFDRARASFAQALSMQGAALGVFHDNELGRIDIDPVIVVGSHSQVETVGAYTHAVGGAYSFADGNGYWPPHVDMAQKAAPKKTPPPGPWPQVRGIARLASLRPAPRKPKK